MQPDDDRRGVSLEGQGAAWRDEDRVKARTAAVRGRDLLLVLLATLAVLIVFRTTIGVPQTTVGYLLTMMLVQAAVPMAAVYLVIVRGRGIPWRDIGLRPARSGWYLRALGLAFVTLLLVGAINLALQAMMDQPLHNPQVEVLAPLAVSLPSIIAVALLVAVVFPFVEEVVFRGLLYVWLRRFSVPVAYVGSAALFAAAHGILVLLPALFAIGLILAWTYETSDSLWPPILLHGTFNGIMLILLYAAIAADAPPLWG